MNKRKLKAHTKGRYPKFYPKFDVWALVSGYGLVWHRVCASDVSTADEAWMRFMRAYPKSTCKNRRVKRVKA